MLLVILFLVCGNTSLATEPLVVVKQEQPPKYEIYEVTAYTLRESECGKSPSHPDYGITASGSHVKEGRTIAAPQGIPFGTKIYIPYFDTTFTVEDRGGAIKGKRLDVYMEKVNDALKFGRRELKIQILD